MARCSLRWRAAMVVWCARALAARCALTSCASGNLLRPWRSSALTTRAGAPRSMTHHGCCPGRTSNQRQGCPPSLRLPDARPRCDRGHPPRTRAWTVRAPPSTLQRHARSLARSSSDEYDPVESRAGLPAWAFSGRTDASRAQPRRPAPSRLAAGLAPSAFCTSLWAQAYKSVRSCEANTSCPRINTLAHAERERTQCRAATAPSSRRTAA